MNAKDVKSILRERIKEAGSYEKAAKRLGVSLTSVSYLMANRRAPSPKLLDRLGLKKVVTYERKDE